eukprot:TRINITY_DN845_c0_g1_i1.p1 TRINITY_DN845_c0_g1~~TRINITY_DN845_c0_g1_i1.p1  ORF type:complete len:535 (+),score=120.12 TRINITY_DN845_c0_g1_i1:129-1733(+)
MEFDQLFVRHWDVWESGKVSHIIVQPIISVGDGWNPSGYPIDMTFGYNLNTPVPPDGGMEQIDVSPDGMEIAFTCAYADADSNSAWNTSWRVYTISLVDSSFNYITQSILARTQNPKYSPDGKYIAFLSMNRPGYEADKLHINRYDRDTGEIVTVTNTIDISFSGTIEWTHDSTHVIVDADYFGSHLLFSIDMINVEQKNPPLPLFYRATNMNVVRVPGGNTMTTMMFLFTRNSMSYPDDIWSFNITNSGITLTQITFENADILSGYYMSDPISLYFTSAIGDSVQAWVVPPYVSGDNNNNTKYPVTVLIHGGPEGSWGDDWSYRWNPQLFAADGNCVIMINPHGSTGFGQSFTDAVNGDWGGLPFKDIINGTTYILNKFDGWMDSTKVTACGASYGGYMVNWIQGQQPDQLTFKALVTHDGIFDTTQGFYATDELWFPSWEFKGLPWDNPLLYEKFNPASYVKNWKTPHLIIHGNHDYRLPLNHGLSAFTALQRKGIPSKLLYFTMENHWVLKDSNSIKWYQTVLSWLKQWTQ